MLYLVVNTLGMFASELHQRFREVCDRVVKPEDVPIDEGLPQALIAALPCGMFLIDKERRIRALNRVAQNVLGLGADEFMGQTPCQAVRCIHANQCARNPGRFAQCQQCPVFFAPEQVLRTGEIFRAIGRVYFRVGSRVHERNLLVSASPMKRLGMDSYVLLAVEDLSSVKAERISKISPEAYEGLLGCSPIMLGLYQTIDEIAGVNATVLIYGESGVGKELVAAAIHSRSKRARKHFVPIHCGALPETLIESELFGHAAGAFTGASRDKEGRLEMAGGGTLFLDEVGDLTPKVQVALLRVLEEKKFNRVGSNASITLDTRVVSATNKNLWSEVQSGRFREDLYYRLNVICVHVPPLRNRPEDVPVLAEHFLGLIAEEMGRPCNGFSRASMAAMLNYAWPGNVRQLRSVVQRAALKCHKPEITLECLETAMLPGQDFDAPVKRPQRRKLASDTVEKALAEANGNKKLAASLLGVSRATLYRFLADWRP